MSKNKKNKSTRDGRYENTYLRVITEQIILDRKINGNLRRVCEVNNIRKRIFKSKNKMEHANREGVVKATG